MPVTSNGIRNESHFETLERVLDQSNLHELMLHLARICYEKSEHIAENWQDMETAKAWESAAKQLGNVAEYKAIRGVSQ